MRIEIVEQENGNIIIRRSFTAEISEKMLTPEEIEALKAYLEKK